MVSISSIVIASVLSQSVLAKNVYNGVAKFDFGIHRGNSKSEMVEGDKARFVKRDGSVDVELSNQDTFYLTELKVGSEKESVKVLLDTGSSDLWLMSSKVSCQSSSSSSGTSTTSRKRSLFEVSGRDEGEEVTEKRGDASENKGFFDSLIPPIGGGGATTIIETIIGTATGTSPGSIETESGSGSGSGSSSGSSSGSGSGSGSNTCTSYGSFNTAKSDTFKKNSSASDFKIEYADGTYAQGIWGYDTVSVAGTTVKDLTFGLVEDTSSDIGVLGIGLPGLETTYSSGDGSSSYQYQNLPMKLKDEGIIHKTLYSLYLGDSDSKTGSLLFGAVDTAKYSGDLKTVPIVNTLSSSYSHAIKLEIVVDSISVNTSSDSSFVTEKSYSAILDSGSTLSYFTSSLLEKFADLVGGEYSSAVDGYSVDCVDDDSVKVIFNFSGKDIEVPLSNLLIKYGNNKCYLGVFKSNYVLLGDNFLRSTYAVFDLEDYEISLAQAKYTSDESIKVVTSTVPGASNAKYYSSTSVVNSEAAGTATSLLDKMSSAQPSIPKSVLFSVPIVTVFSIFSALFLL